MHLAGHLYHGSCAIWGRGSGGGGRICLTTGPKPAANFPLRSDSTPHFAQFPHCLPSGPSIDIGVCVGGTGCTASVLDGASDGLHSPVPRWVASDAIVGPLLNLLNAERSENHHQGEWPTAPPSATAHFRGPFPCSASATGVDPTAISANV